jgi:hypothetical protein
MTDATAVPQEVLLNPYVPRAAAPAPLSALGHVRLQHPITRQARLLYSGMQEQSLLASCIRFLP